MIHLLMEDCRHVRPCRGLVQPADLALAGLAATRADDLEAQPGYPDQRGDSRAERGAHGGCVVSAIRDALMAEVPFVDELVVDTAVRFGAGAPASVRRGSGDHGGRIAPCRRAPPARQGSRLGAWRRARDITQTRQALDMVSAIQGDLRLARTVRSLTLKKCNELSN